MQSPTKNMKLLYKSKFVLTYLGFLECDKIEAIANNDKSKISKINKEELCKVINKFCEGINKYATYYEGGIQMNFKNDLATIPDESEQKELLERLLKSPSLRKSPVKSPPKKSLLEKLLKSPSLRKSPVKSPPKKSPPRPPPPLSPPFHTPNKSPAKAVRNLSPDFDKIEVCAVVHNNGAAEKPEPPNDSGSVPPLRAPKTPLQQPPLWLHLHHQL